MSEIKRYSLADISSYLETVSSPETENIILVGGQALNLWAEIYINKDHFLRPFLSKDIDFMISDKKTMEKCSSLWKGELKTTDDFVSPSLGLCLIENTSGKVKADFLRIVYGIPDNELKKHKIKVNFKNISLNVLHPIHCLQSRMANIVNLKEKQNEHCLNQLKISIEIVHNRIINLLIIDERRLALDETNWAYKTIANKMFSKKICQKYGVDLFKAIPNDNRLGEKYINLRYPQMKKRFEKIHIQTKSK